MYSSKISYLQVLTGIAHYLVKQVPLLIQSLLITSLLRLRDMASSSGNYTTDIEVA